MGLARYLSVLDPFLMLVTLLMVLGIVQLGALCIDLAIRAVKGEQP
jgi:hypothetical protein